MLVEKVDYAIERSVAVAVAYQRGLNGVSQTHIRHTYVATCCARSRRRRARSVRIRSSEAIAVESFCCGPAKVSMRGIYVVVRQEDVFLFLQPWFSSFPLRNMTNNARTAVSAGRLRARSCACCPARASPWSCGNVAVRRLVVKRWYNDSEARLNAHCKPFGAMPLWQLVAHVPQTSRLADGQHGQWRQLRADRFLVGPRAYSKGVW